MSLERPTSPHLTIYRPLISWVPSIIHRISGVGLYLGLVLFTVWLCTAAYWPDRYADLHECLSSPVGKLFMMGWTAAFYFHFGNGIRHLFWDIGKGFELPTMAKSGWAVILFAAIMTGLTWGFVLQG
ncbi:MAG: succinate dehydrogenase, cytochrome b556 subunit [Alphaproteobacteria bacterium]